MKLSKRMNIRFLC